ncbi:MAG: hypothetical protein Q6373_005170 [Candidatus Sigynarchaeota archaeon]
MGGKKASLYNIASKVRDEAFLEGQLQFAGSNQARVLERLEKNRNDAKRQQLALKLVYSAVLGFLPIVPLYAYFQVTDILKGSMIPVDILVFISVMLLVIYFGMVAMYLFILGVQSVSGFMSGEAFEWLEVLPIPRKDLQKIAFVVLWRAFDVPIIVVVLAFPTIMAVVTGSVIVFFTCLVASILNGLFLFCIVVLIAEKFNRVLKGGETNSRKASAIRVFAMLGAVIAMSSTGLVINVVMRSMETIISSFAGLQDASTVNVLISLIPFPFAASFLVSFAILPTIATSTPLILSSVLGILILALLTWLLYRRVLGKLRSITSHAARTTPDAVKESTKILVVRDIKPVTPVKAFMRKDLASITRDFQGAIYLFMPLVYPFVIFLPSMQGLQSITGVDLFIFAMLLLVILVVMNAGMLVTGLLSIDDSGASIIASLPVIPRDQAKAKLKIICTVQLASSLLSIIFSVGVPEALPLMAFFLGYCPVSVTVAMVTFAAKVRLFGKMRYKYVLDEVNVERKALKWVAILGIDSALLGGLFFLTIFAGPVAGTWGIVLMISAAGGIGFVLILSILNAMFPKMQAKNVG